MVGGARGHHGVNVALGEKVELVGNVKEPAQHRGPSTEDNYVSGLVSKNRRTVWIVILVHCFIIFYLTPLL